MIKSHKTLKIPIDIFSIMDRKTITLRGNKTIEDNRDENDEGKLKVGISFMKILCKNSIHTNCLHIIKENFII